MSKGKVAKEVGEEVVKRGGKILRSIFGGKSDDVADVVIPPTSGLRVPAGWAGRTPAVTPPVIPAAGGFRNMLRTGWNKIPGPSWLKKGVLGLGALGAGAVFGLPRFFGGTPDPTFSSIPDGYDPIAANERNLEEYFRRIEEIYGDVTPYDYVGSAQGRLNRQQAALDAYLQDVGVASQEMAQQVEDRYRDVSLNMLGAAQAGQRTGQLSARDIDYLYGQLADEGVAPIDTGTITSGMTPMGGEAATAPQTVRTYGRSLADYLGAETAAATAAGERLAAATGGLGAGIGAGMGVYGNQAERAQRFAFEMRREEALAAAEAQAAAERRDIEESRREREAAMARLELEAEAELGPLRAVRNQATTELTGAFNTEWQKNSRLRNWTEQAAAASGVPAEQSYAWFIEQIAANPVGVAKALQQFGVDTPLSVQQMEQYWLGQ